MKNIFALFIIALFLGACSGIKVVSDRDNTIDFSSYKTLEFYGWEENSDKILNRFDKERIENAFGTEFANRGISVVEKGQGDMIVSLYVVTEKKTKTVANTTTTGFADYYSYADYYDFGPGFGWGMGHSTTTYNQYDYEVGTLIISAYDAKKKQLIWEAIGTGTVDDNPNNAEEKIGKAVAQIMAEYPVTGK